MRALVASGGGSKGAWQATSLYHLLYDLETRYDVLCGISVGAIACAFLAQFPVGQEKQAAFELIKMWSKISTRDIYQRWFPFGAWHALWKTSFFDSSHLQRLIRENIKLDKIRASNKQVYVGAVSITSGKYKIFDQTSDDFIEAVIASASFPGFLSAVKIGDELYSDGGVKSVSPIATAIDNGATEIDIVMTSPDVRNKYFIEDPIAIDIIKRSLDLSADKIMSNDIDKMLMYNKLAEAGFSDKKIVRTRVIRPEFNLIDNLLDFDPKKIKKMMDLGYIDAIKGLAAGE